MCPASAKAVNVFAVMCGMLNKELKLLGSVQAQFFTLMSNYVNSLAL